MQKVPEQFQMGGFTLRQIKRIGNIAVYEQSKAGRVLSYEVVKIRLAKAETIMGKSYLEREVYPSNESWGKDAFTLVDEDEARHKCQKWTQELGQV